MDGLRAAGKEVSLGWGLDTDEWPRLAEMMDFARRIGTRLDLCLSGRPCRDMACHVDLGILSEAAAAEFGRLFSPGYESPIPLL